ncbi:MAG TPA: thioredoxin family protein [Acidobacteriota bacterium]|nr:thioredoxin family protein [Acidobacteriota bacterium]
MNHQTRNQSRICLLLCIALLAASAALAQNGDSANGRLSQLVRVGIFEVSIDGTVDHKAQVFQSPQPRAFLIRSPQLDSAVVLQLDGQKVGAMSTQHVNLGTDQAQVDSGYSLADEGQFQLSQTSLDFTFQGHSVQMKAKGDLLGFISSQDIRDFDTLWSERQHDYQPSQVDLNRIRGAGQGKEFRVVTYFGSWCPHCQKRVPHLMQIEAMLSDSDVDFSYYGIPRPPAFGQDPEAIEKEIDSVPTAIIYQGDQEVGRLTRDDWETPEESLAKLLEAL